MKIRNGFVSNSSSSSFVIKLDDINSRQKMGIYDHRKELEKDGCEDDAWDISENANVIKGTTSMDNFDMEDYLTNTLNIDNIYIEWSEY